MEKVIELGRRRVFTLDEAQAIVPLIQKITNTYSQQVQAAAQRLEVAGAADDELTQKIENEINQLVETWQTKIEKLGGLTRGLWLVDFDGGNGYFCWKFPEDRIAHWHRYDQGFSGRVKISSIDQPLLAREKDISI